MRSPYRSGLSAIREARQYSISKQCTRCSGSFGSSTLANLPAERSCTRGACLLIRPGQARFPSRLAGRRSPRVFTQAGRMSDYTTL